MFNYYLTGKMKKLTIILCLVFSAFCRYQTLDCFRVEHAFLWNGNTVPMTNASSGYSAVVPWTNPAPQIFNHVIVLVGFKLNVEIGNLLSYWVTLKANDTQGLISLTTERGRILSLKFMIALVTFSCSKHIQFIKGDHNCTALNQTMRGVNANEDIILRSTYFNFTSVSDYVVTTYITAVRSLSSSSSQVIQVGFQNVQVNLNNFTIYLRSFDTTHIIHSVSFSVVLFNITAFIPSLAYFTAVSDLNLTSFIFSQNLGIPDQFYDMGYEDKCLVGLFRFNHPINLPNGQLQLLQIGHNITGIVMNGADSLYINTICLMLCDYGSYNTFVGSTYICQPYPDYVTHCIAFDSSKNCVKCKDNYALMSAYSCSECNGKGWIVEGGCTTIFGCSKVRKIGADIYPTVCLSCEPGLFIDMFGECRCASGELVTGKCIDMAGCLATKIQLGAVVCTACNPLDKFKYVNNTCVCISADYQVKNRVCVPVCGDGRVIEDQQCDDGNEVAEDGCGGCIIQTHFRCSGGSPITPSVCRYFGKPIDITYVGVSKTAEMNQAVFTFKVSPPVSLIGQMNLTQYFHFESLVPHSLPVWSYANSSLIMKTDYYQNLEGTTANFTFTFDGSKFHQMGININITIESNGLKLVMMSKMVEVKLLSDFLFYMMVVVIIIIVVGSVSRKMIGVEMLITYQTIFFVHLSTTSYNDVYSKFKYLSYLVGNPAYYFSPFSNIQVLSNIQKLPFSYKNSQITLILVLTFFSLLSILYAGLWIANSMKPQFTRLNRAKTIIYERGIFPLLVGTCMPISLICCQLRDQDRSYELLSDKEISSIKLALCMLIYLAVFYQIRPVFTSKKSENASNSQFKPSYVPIFLLFMLAQLIVIAFATKMASQYAKEIEIVIAILMFYWELKATPYNRYIHNAGIFLHQLVIVFFCLWSILRDYTPELQKQGNEILAAFLFLLLLLLSLIVNTIRVVVSFKEDCQELTPQPAAPQGPTILSIENEVAQRLKESVTANNPYQIQNLKQKMFNQYYNEEEIPAKQPLVHKGYNKTPLIDEMRKIRQRFKKQIVAKGKIND